MDAVVSEHVRVLEQGSNFAFQRKLLISTGKIDPDVVLLRVGSVGYANKSAELEVVEFIFFERASDEIYEIRVMDISEYHPRAVTYLISHISPSQIFGNVSRLNERILWNSEDAAEQRFTESERDFVKAKLSLFEKRISDDYAVSEELRDFVHEKIDYLSQALERQTKMDWFYTSIGVFTSIAMACGVSAANDDKFWHLIKLVLGIPVEMLLGNLITFNG